MSDEDTPKSLSPSIKNKEAFYYKCKQFNTTNPVYQRARAKLTKLCSKSTRNGKQEYYISPAIDKIIITQIEELRNQESIIQLILSKQVIPIMKIPPKKKVLIIGLENTLVSKSVQSAEVLYEKIDIKMNIRPSADSFINIMSCFYELAIYSCYSSEFIKDILEIIDPKNIVKIILSKGDCYNFGDGNYLKDIRKVSNSMKDVVIVDSSMYCFALCRRNGLFISPYNGSSKDKELQSLGQFLMEISAVDDIRIEIKKKHPFLEMLGDFS